MAGKVFSINGDASEIIREQLSDKSDRTLMLLPERSDEFLESAISATKKWRHSSLLFSHSCR